MCASIVLAAMTLKHLPHLMLSALGSGDAFPAHAHVYSAVGFVSDEKDGN